jgi:hypothetical protein
MPHVDCENCGATFWREPHEAWKTRCTGCWLESQDPNSPLRVQNLEAALGWAIEELGRRQDLTLAFAAFLPFMLAAAAQAGDRSPLAQRCRRWLAALDEALNGSMEVAA